MLIDALPTDMHINWDDGCTAARILPKKKVQVDLEDGSTDICDFLIADDGANSKLRASLLPSDTLNYAGAILFNGVSIFPDGKPGLLANQWGINLTGQGKAFLTFPVDDNTGVWVSLTDLLCSGNVSAVRNT